jgi:hypothetical protein
MKISASKSPQDISEEEAELGFQKLVLQGMDAEPELLHLFEDAGPPVIVARILSSHEILLKIFDLDRTVEYSHLEFGYSASMGVKALKSETDWTPVDAPCKDAAIFLQEYGVGIHKTHSLPGAPFTPVKFKYHTP